MIRNKANFTFDIQPNSVKVYHNKQCVIYNTYNCPSRHKFNRFKNTLANSPKERYNDFDSLYRLARLCEIKGTGGVYVTVHKNIAY